MQNTVNKTSSSTVVAIFSRPNIVSEQIFFLALALYPQSYHRIKWQSESDSSEQLNNQKKSFLGPKLITSEARHRYTFSTK